MTDDLLREFAELNPVADPDRLVALDAPDLPADPVLRAVLEHTRIDDDRPDPMRSVHVRNTWPARTRGATQGRNGDMQATEVRPDQQPTVHRRPRTLATVGAAAAVVLVVIAGLVVLDVAQRETRMGFADPAAVDVCALLDRADRQVTPRRGNAGEVLPLPDTPWGARACAVDVFDLETECVLLDPDKSCGFNYLHLLWYPQPTTYDEAEQLVTQPSYLLPAIEWGVAGPNRWTTGWMNHIGPTFMGSAVAVVEEPYFFVVTDEDENKARAVADAIVELLNDLPTRSD